MEDKEPKRDWLYLKFGKIHFLFIRIFQIKRKFLFQECGQRNESSRSIWSSKWCTTTNGCSRRVSSIESSWLEHWKFSANSNNGKSTLLSRFLRRLSNFTAKVYFLCGPGSIRCPFEHSRRWNIAFRPPILMHGVFLSLIRIQSKLNIGSDSVNTPLSIPFCYSIISSFSRRFFFYFSRLATVRNVRNVENAQWWRWCSIIRIEAQPTGQFQTLSNPLNCQSNQIKQTKKSMNHEQNYKFDEF